MHSVRLIAFTSILHHEFIDGFQKAIGRSPTRELDLKNLSGGQLSNYAKALDNVIHNDFAMFKSSLDHISLTMLISTTDIMTLKAIANLTSGKATWFEHKGIHSLLLTASVAQYVWMLKLLCHRDIDIETRAIGNSIYNFIDQAGFRSLFKKNVLSDQTFTLE